jgi:hypothetical protein
LAQGWTKRLRKSCFLIQGVTRERPRSATPSDATISEAMGRLETIARTGTELITVAVFRLRENQNELSRELAEKACNADPNCWKCWHAYALATFRAGDAARAATIQQSALDHLPETVRREDEVATKAALHYYKAAIGKPEAPPGPGPTVFLPW